MRKTKKIIAVIILVVAAFVVVRFFIRSYMNYEDFRGYVNAFVELFTSIIAVLWAIFTLKNTSPNE